MRHLLALVTIALLLGCRLPPNSQPAADGGLADTLPPAADLAADRLLADTAIDPSLRARLFAEVEQYLRADDPGAAPALLGKLDGEYRAVPASLLAEAVRARSRLPSFPALGLHRAS